MDTGGSMNPAKSIEVTLAMATNPSDKIPLATIDADKGGTIVSTITIPSSTPSGPALIRVDGYSVSVTIDEPTN